MLPRGLQAPRPALRRERAAVEVAHQVGGVGAPEHPALVVVVPLHCQRKEIGHLRTARQIQVAGALPVDQVARGEQGVGVPFKVQRHDPALALRVPDHLGVAVLASLVREHGIALVLVPGGAAVGAERQALGVCNGRPSPLAGGGIEQHDGRLRAAAQPGGVVVVDYGTAGEHAPEGIGIEGHRPFRPVHQILAHRQAPVHVAPLGAVGVVLVEQVIGSGVVDQAVGIVEPAAARRKVELWTQWLAVQLGSARRLRRATHAIQGGSALVLQLHARTGGPRGTEIGEHLVVGVCRIAELDVELADVQAGRAQAHAPGDAPPAHRENQVAAPGR